MYRGREFGGSDPRLDPEEEISTKDQSRNPVIYSAELGCLPTVACFFVLLDGFAQGDFLKVAIGGGGLLAGADLVRKINPNYNRRRE
jgi:hypothetical protein